MMNAEGMDAEGFAHELVAGRGPTHSDRIRRGRTSLVVGVAGMAITAGALAAFFLK